MSFGEARLHGALYSSAPHLFFGNIVHINESVQTCSGSRASGKERKGQGTQENN